MRKFEEACCELVESGGCKAECCGIVPIPEATWQKYHLLASEQKEVLFESGNVFPISSDARCVFLDRGDYSCKI